MTFSHLWLPRFYWKVTIPSSLTRPLDTQPATSGFTNMRRRKLCKLHVMVALARSLCLVRLVAARHIPCCLAKFFWPGCRRSMRQCRFFRRFQELAGLHIFYIRQCLSWVWYSKRHRSILWLYAVKPCFAPSRPSFTPFSRTHVDEASQQSTMPNIRIKWLV